MYAKVVAAGPPKPKATAPVLSPKVAIPPTKAVSSSPSKPSPPKVVAKAAPAPVKPPVAPGKKAICEEADEDDLGYKPNYSCK